jgi:hypothetical protein
MTKTWTPPHLSLYAPLPLRMTADPNTIAAWATQTKVAPQRRSNHQLTSDTVSEYRIVPHDMETIYLSNDLYGRTFEEKLDLCKWDPTKHRTAGLRFITKNGRLILISMDKSTPGACINKWRTRIRGAWLMSVDGHAVPTLQDAQAVFDQLHSTLSSTCTLLFSHPDTSPDITHNGLPIISHDDFTQFTHDQLNNRLDLLEGGPHIRKLQCYDIVESGNVHQYTTRVM